MTLKCAHITVFRQFPCRIFCGDGRFRTCVLLDYTECFPPIRQCHNFRSRHSPYFRAEQCRSYLYAR